MTWFLPALLLGIPLVAAVVVTVAPARQAKWIALAATTITFVHSVILAVAFEHWHDGGFGLSGVLPWFGIESIGISLSFAASTRQVRNSCFVSPQMGPVPSDFFARSAMSMSANSMKMMPVFSTIPNSARMPSWGMKPSGLPVK